MKLYFAIALFGISVVLNLILITGKKNSGIESGTIYTRPVSGIIDQAEVFEENPDADEIAVKYKNLKIKFEALKSELEKYQLLKSTNDSQLKPVSELTEYEKATQELMLIRRLRELRGAKPGEENLPEYLRDEKTYLKKKKITALAGNGEYETIYELINNGEIDVNDTLMNPAMTLIDMAIIQKNVSALRELIDLGADVNVTESSNEVRPVHRAVMFGSLGTLEVLVEHGAELNMPAGFSEETPFVMAAGRGNVEIMQYLTESGADITGVNLNGNNALEVALASPKSDERTIEYLLSIGFELEDKHLEIVKNRRFKNSGLEQFIEEELKEAR